MDGTPVMGKGVKNLKSKRKILPLDMQTDLMKNMIWSELWGWKLSILEITNHLIWTLCLIYRYKMLAYKEWLSLYRDGKLNDIQSQFLNPKDLRHYTILTKIHTRSMIFLSQKIIRKFF